MKIDFLVIVLLSACSASTYAQWQPSGATTGNIYYTGGRVGVGTSQPASPFHIHTSASLEGMWLTHSGNSNSIRFYSPNLTGGAYSNLTLAGDAGIIFSGAGGINTANYGFVIAPHRSSSSGLRISDLGNVSINTTKSIASLNVGGNIFVEKNFEGETSLSIANSNTSTLASRARLLITNGNVQGNIDAVGYSAGNPSMIIRTLSPHDIQFGTNGTERMRLTGGGNFGVGTAAPQAKFHINTGAISAVMKFQRDNANLYGFELSGSIFGLFDFTNSNYIWRTVGSNLALLENSGNVGIGTNGPTEKLAVRADNAAISITSNLAANNSSLRFRINESARDGYIVYKNDGRLSFHLDGENASGSDINEYLTILPNGNVGIGTIGTNGYKLAVHGTIGAREVNVNVDQWPDYVFDSTYNLPPLSEVEAYIKTNKHLPEIPSEAEVKENGVAVGEMNALLLKKIEELMLYLLEQKKLIEAQSELIKKQSKRIELIEEKL